MKKRENTTPNSKRWLSAQIKPYRFFIAFLAFLSVLSSLLSLGFAFMTRYFINGAGGGDRQAFLSLAVLLPLILLFGILLHTLQNYLAEKCRAKIRINLQKELFLKLLSSEETALKNYHSGDLLTRLSSDVSEIEQDTVNLFPSVCGLFVQGLGAFIALLSLDVVFTLLFLCSALVIGGGMLLLRKNFKRYHRETQELDGQNRAFMQESLSSVDIVKAYSGEGKTLEKSENILQNYYKKRMARNGFRTAVYGGFALVSNLGSVFALIWFGYRLFTGTADLGAMVSSLLLLSQLRAPLTGFASVLPTVYARAASAERLYEIAVLPPDAVEARLPYPYEGTRAICLQAVDYAYSDKPVFSGATARIETGKLTCIVGESGIGKSTLFKLLLSLLKPDAGEIFFEDADGQKLPISAPERELFSYLPQGNFLFSGTIKENLTFFTGEKTDDEIRAALNVAAAEFVYNLPKGINSFLGERGVGLSEGQLQRLALARAILSDRPILLLDEATSALDAETEQTVLNNLRALENKTCIIVTHRPAALALADRKLKIENGKITP